MSDKWKKVMLSYPARSQIMKHLSLYDKRNLYKAIIPRYNRMTRKRFNRRKARVGAVINPYHKKIATTHRDNYRKSVLQRFGSRYQSRLGPGYRWKQKKTVLGRTIKPVSWYH